LYLAKSIKTAEENPSYRASGGPFDRLELTEIPGEQDDRGPSPKRRPPEDDAIPSLDTEMNKVKSGLEFVALTLVWGRGLAANRSLLNRHVDLLVDEILRSDLLDNKDRPKQSKALWLAANMLRRLSL
jgi:hypothetical protein